MTMADHKSCHKPDTIETQEMKNLGPCTGTHSASWHQLILLGGLQEQEGSDPSCKSYVGPCPGVRGHRPEAGPASVQRTAEGLCGSGGGDSEQQIHVAEPHRGCLPQSSTQRRFEGKLDKLLFPCLSEDPAVLAVSWV